MRHPDQQIVHVIRVSRSPYLKGRDRLRVDERWRSELSPEQTRAISRRLGRIAIYRERYGLPHSGAVQTLGEWCGGLVRKIQR